MCSISLRHIIVYCAFVCYVCHADGYLERFKRDEDVDTKSGASKTVGEVISEVLSKLFGKNTTLTDVADKPVDDDTKEALQSVLSNVSQGQQSADSNDGTNLQAQDQEVTSQGLIETTTTESGTTSPPSTTPYYSSSLTQQSTTGQPEEDRCYTDAVLQNFCAVPDDMTDVSFWDLYSVFFSDTVLDALMIGCSKGSWCLKDRFDYWDSLIVERVDMVMNSEIAGSMCNPQVQPCISRVANNFVNCSMYEQMAYTTDVLKVICGLRQNNQLTSACYKHVISALHVTLADILREEEKEPVSDDTCESPEAYMTKGLICVENSCPGESETFHSFKPWAWFTKVVNDLIQECNYDSKKCMALLQPPPGYLHGNEMETMVGISVATMVTALTLTIVVCTCYKRHRRNAVVKEGYQRLLTEGDES